MKLGFGISLGISTLYESIILMNLSASSVFLPFLNAHIEEKYKPESYREVISLWERELPTRMKTTKGKSLYPELLENLKKNLL